uniref:CDP-diacylglycerol--glycerol-3-phosphate 3-phosphatidyltransferase n=1 Tax=Strigamia maritima TaxID=126957 RepID=T1J1T8_STRMM
MWTKLIPGVVAPVVTCWWKQIYCDAKARTNPERKSDVEPSVDVRDTVPKSLAWIASHSPSFPIDGDRVTVLNSPKEFYQTILTQIRKAKRRITLSSLYLGTGQLERELVEELDNTLNRADSRVQMLIVLDYTRGSRGRSNSCTMLQPLLRNRRLNVALFHTPRLRGLLKHLAPDRWNELFGVQHMKVFVFDDNVLISGSISKQRRNLFPSPRFGRQSDVASVVDRDETEFKAKSRQTIMRVLEEEKEKEKEKETKDTDTIVTPLLQFGPMDITQDESFTKRLFNSTPSNVRAVMATGYFNLTEEYKKGILKRMAAPISIIMASPKVNGFYKAGGVAGAIPSAYTNLAKEFYQQITQSAQQDRIRLFEYERDLWTFHSKGLWLYPSDEDTPFLTLIGSPNFGHRSVLRDLELQFAVTTANRRLRHQLQR